MARRKDLDGLIKALHAIPKSVRAAVEPAVQKGAEELASRMRFLAPDDPKTTAGDLKSSIRVIDTGVPMARRVEASVPGEFDHALAQEYGTVDHPAQPFFWPSVSTAKKRIRRRIDRAISLAVKKEFTR